MKSKVIYNEYVKTFEVDINKKLGLIQQELLEKCMLIIYNIEYTEIKINNTNELYIEGSYNKGWCIKEGGIEPKMCPQGSDVGINRQWLQKSSILI